MKSILREKMTSNINHPFDKLVANSKSNEKEIQGGNRDEKITDSFKANDKGQMVIW